MTEEWRVEVELDDEEHGYTLGEVLRSHDLDDEARKRLGNRVIVTRDGSRIFLYAASEDAAREAERVATELTAAERLTAAISLTRWHPVEEAWRDASVPLPRSEEQRESEELRRERAEELRSEASGHPGWEVRVDLPSLRDTLELGRRLSGEGLDVRRRWRYLLVGAPSEERADEIAERVRLEAPAGSAVHVEPSGGVPHPVFVFMGDHKPGIARDLGL